MKYLEQHHYSVYTKNKNSRSTRGNCRKNYKTNSKGYKTYKQIKNHSKLKSHRNLPKYLQAIPKPQEYNITQHIISSQIINPLSEYYARK
jgi:dsDNA-specific endonuclease/ATPase MutS2